VSGSSRIAVPLLKAEDVIPHLGRPGHWKQGRSAKSLADSWFEADGIPKAMQVLLASAPEFRGAKLIDGWLERKTDLGDSCGAPSQTDLLALLDVGDELAVLAVEAKVDESFGPFVHEWIADGSLKKHKRLRALCARLGIEADDALPLRYQLLHRAVAALIEAKRFHLRKAVLAVQSFCPDATGHEDFLAFCEVIGFTGSKRAKLSGPRHIGDIDLWVGWMGNSVREDFFDESGHPDFPTPEEIGSDAPLRR
jgi:hypothetical protein